LPFDRTATAEVHDRHGVPGDPQRHERRLLEGLWTAGERSTFLRLCGLRHLKRLQYLGVGIGITVDVLDEFLLQDELFRPPRASSASTGREALRPMVRFATISVNAAASAALKAAELPPPGTGSPDAVLAR